MLHSVMMELIYVLSRLAYDSCCDIFIALELSIKTLICLEMASMRMESSSHRNRGKRGRVRVAPMYYTWNELLTKAICLFQWHAMGEARIRCRDTDVEFLLCDWA